MPLLEALDNNLETYRIFGGNVGATEVISISKCEIELVPGSKPYIGKPTSERDQSQEQTGRLSTFRVTSSDELNLVAGLVEWDTAAPEIKPIDLLGGLQKHNALDNRGSMTLVHARDGNWLAPLRVMKYSPDKKYFTLHGATTDEIDEFLGQSITDLLFEVGALKVGTRQEIDGETNKTAKQLAMLVAPGDLRTLAVAYTVTRPLAVINDFGLVF
jgi:hypothetical protein